MAHGREEVVLDLHVQPARHCEAEPAVQRAPLPKPPLLRAVRNTETEKGAMAADLAEVLRGDDLVAVVVLLPRVSGVHLHRHNKPSTVNKRLSSSNLVEGEGCAR